MSKYSIVLQYDETDQIYIASIPELQDCMAHEKIPEKAFKEVSIVCDMWIETAKEEGIPIPEPNLFNSISA